LPTPVMAAFRVMIVGLPGRRLQYRPVLRM
jgi:hypothetical protein